jgi:hypothetical protein
VQVGSGSPCGAGPYDSCTSQAYWCPIPGKNGVNIGLGPGSPHLLWRHEDHPNDRGVALIFIAGLWTGPLCPPVFGARSAANCYEVALAVVFGW